MGTVFLISGNRMAQGFHVDADLILASGLQLHFQERIFLVCADLAVMGHGMLAAVVFRTGMNLHGFALGQPRGNRACILLDFALDQSGIDAFFDDFFPIILQLFFQLFGFCEQHDAGGIPVQAMHDEYPVCFVVFFDVLA